MENNMCPRANRDPENLAISMAKNAREDIKEGKAKKMNAIWLETSGCFGEVISLLNTNDPDVIFLLKDIVDLRFLGSITGDEGEQAYERILEVLNTDFVFLVCGAIPTKSNGLYTRIATYKGKIITAMEAVSMLAEKAKYIISIGTCAAYGGPTAASPNISEASSLRDYLGVNNVIQIPGCPANPVWTVGTLGYLVSYGMPELDSDGRPVAFFGTTIHDLCQRRSFFDNGIFAEKLGDEECMIKVGCKGPRTKALCPINRWNQSDNWPIGTNTTCIGCAGPGFPDKNEPFINYGGE